MAHFYGTVQGHRGMASRLGTASSGITAMAQGWDIGVKVYIESIEGDGDVVTVYLTCGGNGGGESFFLGRFKRSDLDQLTAARRQSIACNTHNKEVA